MRLWKLIVAAITVFSLLFVGLAQQAAAQRAVRLPRSAAMKRATTSKPSTAVKRSSTAKSTTKKPSMAMKKPTTKPAIKSSIKPKGYQGNSLKSNKAQQVYGIYRKSGGKVSMHKVGISGQKLNRQGVSYRASSQVSALNRSPAARRSGTTYSARPLKNVTPSSSGATARRRATWAEQQVVTKEAAKIAAREKLPYQHPKVQRPLPGNSRPKPAPFSPIPRVKK